MLRNHYLDALTRCIKTIYMTMKGVAYITVAIGIAAIAYYFFYEYFRNLVCTHVFVHHTTPPPPSHVWLLLFEQQELQTWRDGFHAECNGQAVLMNQRLQLGVIELQGYAGFINTKLYVLLLPFVHLTLILIIGHRIIIRHHLQRAHLHFNNSYDMAVGVIHVRTDCNRKPL
jgi:hypothetical protein